MVTAGCGTEGIVINFRTMSDQCLDYIQIAAGAGKVQHGAGMTYRIGVKSSPFKQMTIDNVLFLFSL